MRSYPKKNSHKQRLLDDIKLLIEAYPNYQSKKFNNFQCILCDKYSKENAYYRFGCTNCSLGKFNSSKFACNDLREILDANAAAGTGLEFLNAMYGAVRATPREKLTPYYIKTIGVPRNLQKELKKWSVSSYPDDAEPRKKGAA